MKIKNRYILFCLVLSLGFLQPLYGQQDLSLNNALHAAIKNNPIIHKLNSQYDALKSRVRLNKSPYDFELEASAQYADSKVPQEVVFLPSRIKQNIYNIGLKKDFTTGTSLAVESDILKTRDNSTFALLNSRYESTLGISIQQSLLDDLIGLPENVRIRSDRDRLKSLHLQLWRELEVFLAQIEQMYWSLWGEIQLVNVAKQSEKESKVFYDETIRISKLGLRESDEILQAQTSWYQRQEETQIAINRVANAWIRLRTELGLDDDPEWNEIPDLDQPGWDQDKTFVETLKEGYRNRRDFLAAEVNLELSKRIKKSLRWKSLPKIFATGGYSLTGLDPSFDKSVDQIERSKFPGWNAGIALKHSFGQNADRAGIQQATSDFLAAKNFYQKTSMSVTQSIKTAVNKYKVQLKIYDLDKKIEKNRKKVRDLFKKKFSQGRIPIQDLLRSEEELRRARYSRQVATYQMVLAQLDMWLAQGIYLKEKNMSSSLPGFINKGDKNE